MLVSRTSTTAWLHTLWRTHPPLLLSVALYALLTVFFTAGIFLDDRFITGARAWLKPAKFAVSIMLYSVTLLWMLSFVRGRPRLVNFVAWVTVLMFLIEIVIIPLQAARGVPSHSNISTTLNGNLFSVMGGAIGVLWLTHLAITILVLLQRFERPAFALSLQLGLVITLIGMSVGILMASPLGTLLASGQGVTPPPLPNGVSGAHSIGVPDGGPGLPVVGWSTVGGDLRVGHFIGLHALQILPLFAWLLTRRPRFTEGQRVRLVWTLGLGYLGLTLLVTWQALRAQPLTAPDALSLGVFAALLALVGGAAALITRPIRAAVPG